MPVVAQRLEDALLRDLERRFEVVSPRLALPADRGEHRLASPHFADVSNIDKDGKGCTKKWTNKDVRAPTVVRSQMIVVAPTATSSPVPAEPGRVPSSWVCPSCGRRFRPHRRYLL